MGNQYANNRKPSFWTEANIAKLRELRGQNKSFSKIAHELGATKSQVLSAWHRKILETRFPSDYIKKTEVSAVVNDGKPTLAWVPGVDNGCSYKTKPMKVY